MTDVNNFEKPFPSAPPPYSAYPTGILIRVLLLHDI